MKKKMTTALRKTQPILLLKSHQGVGHGNTHTQNSSKDTKNTITYKLYLIRMFVHVFRQALTEVSVLSDVLRIFQHHRQYMTIDHVYVTAHPSVPTRVQYILKRQV